jgi:hypothetical protein
VPEQVRRGDIRLEQQGKDALSTQQWDAVGLRSILAQFSRTIDQQTESASKQAAS